MNHELEVGGPFILHVILLPVYHMKHIMNLFLSFCLEKNIVSLFEKMYPLRLSVLNLWCYIRINYFEIKQ